MSSVSCIVYRLCLILDSERSVKSVNIRESCLLHYSTLAGVKPKLWKIMPIVVVVVSGSCLRALAGVARVTGMISLDPVQKMYQFVALAAFLHHLMSI